MQMKSFACRKFLFFILNLGRGKYACGVFIASNGVSNAPSKKKISAILSNI